MKLARCPICHASLNLDSLIQDEAGRSLLAEVATLPDFVAKPMLSYLSLFRPVKSDLSNARALRILKEVLAEYKADHILATALVDCVGKLREKRSLHNDTKPMQNHNYLKQVYLTTAQRNNVVVPTNSKDKQSATSNEEEQKVKDAWYFEQANRMRTAGQDPLAESSPIANKLKQLGWKYNV